MTSSSSFFAPIAPLGTVSAEAAAAVLASDAAGSRRFVASDWSPRVLVVDDDDICRIAAQRLLEKLGFTVDVAHDGQEALTMSAGWPYVAVFMDCAMPTVDGYQAARKIRDRDRQSSSALVIAVTAHPRHVCLAAGMDHHIAKPLRLDSLAAECTKLGLLARTDAQPGPPSSPKTRPSTPAAAGAVDTPLLRPPIGSTTGMIAAQTATAAETFVRHASLHLPALWRAANARDIDSLRRIALELKEPATSAGVARVADLCDQMVRAGNQGKTDVATGIEPQLRRALAETADAIRSRLESPQSSDAGAIEPTNGDAAHTAERERPTLRIATADDDRLARRVIEGMIERADGLQLVGTAGSVKEIVELAVTKRPDTVILDWMMPDGGGPEAARQILRQCPDTRVIALTASASPDAYLEMLRAGASGLLVKGCSTETLAQMIRRTAERPA